MINFGYDITNIHMLFSYKAGNKKTNLVSPRKQLGYDEEIQNELVN